MIIQWHMSAISEGLYVNRGDPRSSLSFLICQKQLPGQEKSLMKKRGWNCDRWQPIAQTMFLIYANLTEQSLDSKLKLCTIMANIFIAKQYCRHHFHTSQSDYVSLFFSQKTIICCCVHTAEIQSCCIQCVFSCLF